MSDTEERSTQEVVIPDKMYFKIGEVSQITGVKPYILRYWETEFPIINPAKRKNKHRLYRKKDVEDILLIKRLLYEEKFTIAGARLKLKERNRSGETTSTGDSSVTESTFTSTGEFTADSTSTSGLTTTTDSQFKTLSEFIKDPASREVKQEVLSELQQIKSILDS